LTEVGDLDEIGPIGRVDEIIEGKQDSHFFSTGGSIDDIHVGS